MFVINTALTTINQSFSSKRKMMNNIVRLDAQPEILPRMGDTWHGATHYFFFFFSKNPITPNFSLSSMPSEKKALSLLSIHIFSYNKNTISHLCVIFETASCFAGSQIPQTQSLIPWTGQSIVTVGWQNYITDEVRVTIQALLGEAIVCIFITGQLPDNQSLVYNQQTKLMKNITTDDSD